MIRMTRIEDGDVSIWFQQGEREFYGHRSGETKKGMVPRS